MRQGRDDEGINVLRSAVDADPADKGIRAQLAQLLVTRGDIDGARALLAEDASGSDPELLWTLAEMELRDGRIVEGTEVLERILAEDPSRRDALVSLGCSVAEVNPDAGYECVDVAARAAIAADEWESAAAAFNEFVGTRAAPYSRADATGGDLRRWRARVDDAQRTGAVGGCLPRCWRRPRSSGDCRGSRGARAMGTSQHRAVSARVDAARGDRHRRDHCGTIERTIAVYEHRFSRGQPRSAAPPIRRAQRRPLQPAPASAPRTDGEADAADNRESAEVDLSEAAARSARRQPSSSREEPATPIETVLKGLRDDAVTTRRPKRRSSTSSWQPPTFRWACRMRR